MKSFIAWDTETDLFGPGNQAPPLVCVSFALESHPNEPALLDHKSGAAWVRGRVEQAVYNDSMVLCTHNGFYDYVVVANELQDAQFLKNVFHLMREGRVHDTLVGEWLLDTADGLLSRIVSTKTKSGYQPAPEGHYTLATLANKYAALHLDKSGGARTSFGPLRGTPIEQWPATHVAYAKEDAVATLAVAKAQRARAYADERRPLTNMAKQCEAYLSLQLSRVRGFATDLEATEHYARELLVEIEDGAKSLSKLHLPIEVKNTKTKNKQKVITFSIEDTPLIYRKEGKWAKSTKVLQALIKNAYESQGEEPPRTDKGAVKTDADTLEQCDAPELEPWKDYEQAQKFLNTYVPVLRQGVVHPGYGFTTNGRSSSFKPNIQNLPRKGKVRECFVARPGYYLCSVDYAAQELVTFSQAMRDLVGDGGPLMEAINNDIDPHTLFASQYLFNKPTGVSYEEGTALKNAGDKHFKDARQRAKCFHPETEVLSFGGWKKIGELSQDDLVMQAIPTNGAARLEWAQPLRLTRRRAEPGEMVELKNESLRLRVTKDHRMLGFGQGSHKPFVCAPSELNLARFWLNAGTFNNDAGPIDAGLLRWLRLAVAVQADGSYTRNKEGNLVAIHLGFTKQRKIARLRTLLSGLTYKEQARPINGKVGTFFTLRGAECAQVSALLTPEKTLPWSWVHLPLPLRQAVLEEAKHWDSHIIKGGRSYRYSTTKPVNADVLQAIAAITGHKSRVTVELSRLPNQRDQIILSVKDRAHARGGALECKEFDYEGDVVCLSVPSSFVLVRASGVTAITGQCGNFGFPGGMGVDRFIATQRKEGLIFTKPETQELKATWLAQWKPQKYFAHVKKIVDDYGWVSQLRSGRVRGDAGFTDTANTFFSGLAADMSKDALTRVTLEMYCEPTSPLFGSRVVAFIHDEILAEVPIDRAHGAAMRIGELMVEAGRTWCPDVKSKAEPALMRRWYKGAEAVFDERGMLQPWEPRQ